jgi:hypothetical protein
MGFKKIQISAQNPKGFGFGFTENQQFTTKLIETPYFLVVKLMFHIGYK